ncbi:hypothetical protein GJ496_004550 [Pomphorhynchus laevis]|nr:hypothetical protein GJ496_004550 [Pomphorhynchus laevis]
MARTPRYQPGEEIFIRNIWSKFHDNGSEDGNIVKRKYENSMQMCACFHSGFIGDDLRHSQDLTANNIYTRKQESEKQDLADAFSLTHGDSALALKETHQHGSSSWTS